jgi:hypothetical protein
MGSAKYASPFQFSVNLRISEVFEMVIDTHRSVSGVCMQAVSRYTSILELLFWFHGLILEPWFGFVKGWEAWDLISKFLRFYLGIIPLAVEAAVEMAGNLTPQPLSQKERGEKNNHTDRAGYGWPGGWMAY